MAKTKVDDINRNIYDIKNKDDYEFKMKKGLNREIVEEISKMVKIVKMEFLDFFSFCDLF